MSSEAIGRDNALAVILPERDSNSKNIKDAVRFARELKIRYINKKITLILSLIGIYRMYLPSILFKKSIVERYITKKRESISKSLGKNLYIPNLTGSSNKELCKGLAYYRIKHRIRSALLFYYVELNNYLFVGCANKSEWLTGFFVKYGDGIADIMPLISLYKTQVFAMADYLKLPDYIISKAPSPDLLPGIYKNLLLDLISIKHK
ncbi:MAG: NAD(+) synthase [Candidatus Hydromicrobium sp.]|nr:NAD(+) synthase [Candidatus Hydromicrobium sp.]